MTGCGMRERHEEEKKQHLAEDAVNKLREGISALCDIIEFSAHFLFGFVLS